MTLATQLAEFVYAVDLDRLDPRVPALSGASRRALNPDEIITRVAQIDREHDVRRLMSALMPIVAT